MPLLHVISRKLRPGIWHEILLDFQDMTDSELLASLVNHFADAVASYNRERTVKIFANTCREFKIPAAISAEMTPLQRSITEACLSGSSEHNVISTFAGA